MHACPVIWVAIGRVVVYYAGMPTHLGQELNVSTVVKLVSVAHTISLKYVLRK